MGIDYVSCSAPLVPVVKLLSAKISLQRNYNLPGGGTISLDGLQDDRPGSGDGDFLLAYDCKAKKMRITQRSNCHGNSDLKHYGIYCLVYDSYRNSMLLQYRGNKDLYPFKWTAAVSGHIGVGRYGHGETDREALVREWAEELPLIDVRYAWEARWRTNFEFRNDEEWETKSVYDVELPLTRMHLQLDEEIHGYRIVRMGDLADWISKSPEQFTPGFIAAYKNFLKWDVELNSQ